MEIMLRMGLLVVVFATLAPRPVSSYSRTGHGLFGRRVSTGGTVMAAPRIGRCYTVCPPQVQSTGHDPFYDTAYNILDQEMHPGVSNANGVVLPGRLTQVAGDIEHPIAGYWPDGRRRARPPHSGRFTPPHVWAGRHINSPLRSPFSPLVFLQLRHHTAVVHQLMEDPSMMGGWAAPKPLVPGQYHYFPALRAETQPAPEAPHHNPSACMTVCPKNDVPYKGDEALGGPFGPDPQVQHALLAARHAFGGLTPNHHQAVDRQGVFGPDPLQIPGHLRSNTAQISRPSGFGLGDN